MSLLKVVDNDPTVFDELQKALVSIRDNDTKDCYNITITSGNYTISEQFVISKNFALYGDSSEGPVNISFSFNEDQLTVMEFKAVDFVEIVGVEFFGSPGFIWFENITEIVITNCSFR